MVADSAEPNAYIQGYLTISGFSEEPYIGGPDGFGAVHSGGMNSLFADGSVRFISEFVDPTVIEAVATKGGGEVVGDF
jgi:prepilin-type processing-associated H-X9-DG protein